MPDRTADAQRNLAVFIDLENLALGAQRGKRGTFDITKVLERLLEKGKLIVKRAYADWSRFPEYSATFHEAAIELIEIPKRAMTGKNSADIRMVVDAMDLSWSKGHVDTFAIVTGDSDFSPLVSKLKENGKYVIGLGLRDSTSDLLSENCDEFIYYEDLERQESVRPQPRVSPEITEKKREAFALLLDACAALIRENHEMLYASMVKDTMKRKKPSFDEGYHGYRSFTHLLEDAARLGVVRIERDERSGTYIVTQLNDDRGTASAQVAKHTPERRPRRRRR